MSAPLLRALAEEGYTTPTPIQAKAIPPALEGKDLFGCAQTGTGKTAAFALPILHRLHANPIDDSHGLRRVPRALILAPTRELANQISDSFAAYGRYTGLLHTVIYGGVNQFEQSKELLRGTDILVATPGRLLDLMQQRHVILREVEIFVLDEADRMLDMGFIDPIRRVARELPTPRQTMMFSATMPKEIMHLADSLLHHPVKVTVATVAATLPKIEQFVYMVPKLRKQALLERLLAEPNVESALVFSRTKHGADKITRHLQRIGLSATAIHGDKAQNQREKALENFRSGRVWVLVATDVAARGLDIDGVTHVFNYDIPHEPEAYVHRIGRTGRAGATGVAIALCSPEEQAFLHAIERLTAKRIEVIPTPAGLPEARSGPSHHHGGGHGGGHGRGSHSSPAHAGQGKDNRRRRRR